MRQTDFKALGLRLLMTVHGYRRHRSVELALEDFERRGFVLGPVYKKLFEQLARSLWGLLYDPDRGGYQALQDATDLTRAIENWDEDVLFYHQMKLWEKRHQDPESLEKTAKRNAWPRFVAGQLFVDYGPKLTKKERDMLDRVDEGYELHIDDDWGNPILRRGKEVIRLSISRKRFKVLEEHGVVEHIGKDVA